MHRQPYVKWWTSDFLNGVIDLNAEQIGVYTVLLTLMADKASPVTNDPQWLGRRCGISTRAFNRILGELVEAGKLEIKKDRIGNHRMMREVLDRRRERENGEDGARERWRRWAENNPLPLPFGDPAESISLQIDGKKGREKGREKVAEKVGVKKPKSPENCRSDEITPVSPSRAHTEPRARHSQSQNINPTQPTTTPREENDGAGRGGDDRVQGDDQEAAKPIATIDDRDLWALYEAVAQASGHQPAVPGQISRALDFVKAWRADGLDFEHVVLPTIRAIIAKSTDPTRTLGRFDAAVRHEQARRGATPNRRYRAPETPLLAPEGEDTAFQPLRSELLERMGASTYSVLCNHVRFETIETVTGEQVTAVRDAGGGQAARLKDGHGRAMLDELARQHGLGRVS